MYVPDIRGTIEVKRLAKIDTDCCVLNNIINNKVI